MSKRIISTFVAVFIIGFFSMVAKAEEKSAYTQLGGIYNIAHTVDYLVDNIYRNVTLNQNPALKAVHDAAHTKAGFKVWLTN